MQIHVQQVAAAVLLAAPLVLWALRAVRRGGMKKPVCILLAVLAAGLVGLAIVAEFGVDRWSNKLLVYGLMAGALCGIAVIGLVYRTYAGRQKHGA